MEMNNCCGSPHADDAGHRQDPVNFAWVGLEKVPHSQVYWCYIKTNVKPNMIQNRTDFFFQSQTCPEPARTCPEHGKQNQSDPENIPPRFRAHGLCSDEFYGMNI